MCGVNDVKEVIKVAVNERKFKRKTILFMDEIHRFNKLQQVRLMLNPCISTQKSFFKNKRRILIVAVLSSNLTRIIIVQVSLLQSMKTGQGVEAKFHLLICENWNAMFLFYRLGPI